ncbi:hypothetical protein BPAE_0657g00020 [Botrytis paeoniae]|uniref:Binding protein n=1 Tax=Botrytis paeoniae TaxID=278948 RepID=A0A4Z1ESB8_9HELO|nr:hypothetical protein BPAE_0657g00020 [Botrytis paeoniae]
MFSKTFIATLLASSAAATPIVSARAASNAFSLVSIRSGTDLQNQAITASGGRLWIGKDTASYCPSTVTSCPDGTSTTFVAGENTLSLNAGVPGGQQVYIASDYAVSFTQPHSADTQGGVISGWTYTAGENGSVGSLSFPDYGFIACPGESAGVYGVFLTPGGAGTGNCTNIAVATAPYTGEGSSAWEYI